MVGGVEEGALSDLEANKVILVGDKCYHVRVWWYGGRTDLGWVLKETSLGRFYLK